MKLSRIHKFIFSWSIILLWFTRPFIFRLLNIDFIEPEYLFYFKLIWIGLIPYALYQLIGRKSKRIAKTIAILAGFLVLLLNTLSMICVFSYSNPKYIHKYENKEIRYRILNCGATDGNPTYTLVETNQILFLMHYKEINTNEIDENYWIKQ
jgi:hypothetical protein